MLINNAPKMILLCCCFAFCACAAFGMDLLPHPGPEDVSENPSVELQLFGVQLGTPYAKTKKRLAEQYGDLSPLRSVATTGYDMFLLDKQGKNKLVIIPDKKDPSVVGAIEVHGTHPIERLDFFSDVNLGEPEENIFWKFPKARTYPEPEKGYRLYGVPFSNYSFETKNGWISSIQIRNEHIVLVKSEDNSISLSKNLFFIASKKGYLKEPIAFDKLTELVNDSLRSYCQHRYPMRLAPDGRAYLDINVFQTKSRKLVPGTFLLDTGWTVTAISPGFCQKINCEYLKKKPVTLAPGQKAKSASGGILTLGEELIPIPEVDVLPSTILKFYKGDGMLGGNALFTNPLFINFKHGYLCYPFLSTPKLARALGLKKFDTNYENLTTWATPYLNGELLKRGLLDSGATITSLTKKEIDRLKLKKLGEEKMHINTIYGATEFSTYGPVEIGWPQLGITQTLDAVAEDPGFEESLIGVDFLRHYILGLDLKSDVFYLGE